MKTEALIEMSRHFVLVKDNQRFTMRILFVCIMRMISFNKIRKSSNSRIISCGASIIRPTYNRIFRTSAEMLGAEFWDFSYKASLPCFPRVFFPDLRVIIRKYRFSIRGFLYFSHVTYLRNCLAKNQTFFSKDIENIKVYGAFLPKFGLEGLVSAHLQKRDGVSVFILNHAVHPVGSNVTPIDNLLVECWNDFPMIVSSRKLQDFYCARKTCSIFELATLYRTCNSNKLLLIHPGPGYAPVINQMLEEYDLTEFELYVKPHPAGSISPKLSGAKIFEGHPFLFDGNIINVETSMYYNLNVLGRQSFVYESKVTRNYDLFCDSDRLDRYTDLADVRGIFAKSDERIAHSSQFLGLLV